MVARRGKKKPKKAVSSGGKAEATGASYETLVGVWYCYSVLLGNRTQPLFDLPTSIEILSIRCQTDAPVDDVNAFTSHDGIIFVQAKRTVLLSDGPTSAFASAIDQFVRQFKECSKRTVGKTWSRPLEPTKDRLVLTTRTVSSAKIVTVLPRLLSGLRDRSDVQTLTAVSTSEVERSVAKIVEKCIKRSWKAAYKRSPTPNELGALLRLIWVQQLDLEGGERDRRFMLDQFRINLLVDSKQAPSTLAHLIALIARLRADRSGTDRATLLSHLGDSGIRLHVLPDYRADVAALQKWTTARLQRAPKYVQLLDDDPSLKIERTAWPMLRGSAETRNLLLVGDPGAGKSGLTYRLGAESIAAGHDVVFLPVDLLNIETFAGLNAELGITHDLVDVLTSWPGASRGLLIIDALDAARKPETQRILREVVWRLLQARSPRWRVVASVRRYDLRQGIEWSRMFRGTPPDPNQSDTEFSSVAHVSVRALTDAEIEQIASAFPALLTLFRGSSDKLRDLLRNIFNLHLLADLLHRGVPAADLRTIQTQSELLDSYWHHRVRGDDGRYDAREVALTAVLNHMIAAQTLQVPRLTIRSQVDPDALVDLERADILRAESRDGIPDEDTLLFSHHVLFDYAVARLIFRRGRDPASLISLLQAQRALALMLAPSLSIALADAWTLGGDRKAFWNLAFGLSGDTTLPGPAQLSAPMIVAELAISLADLLPLIDALAGPGVLKSAAENFVPHLIGAIFVRSQYGFPLIGASAGPWMQLAERLLEVGGDRVIFAARSLLAKALEPLR